MPTSFVPGSTTFPVLSILHSRLAVTPPEPTVLVVLRYPLPMERCVPSWITLPVVSPNVAIRLATIVPLGFTFPAPDPLGPAGPAGPVAPVGPAGPTPPLITT